MHKLCCSLKFCADFVTSLLLYFFQSVPLYVNLTSSLYMLDGFWEETKQRNKQNLVPNILSQYSSMLYLIFYFFNLYEYLQSK